MKENEVSSLITRVCLRQGELGGKIKTDNHGSNRIAVDCFRGQGKGHLGPAIAVEVKASPHLAADSRVAHGGRNDLSGGGWKGGDGHKGRVNSSLAVEDVNIANGPSIWAPTVKSAMPSRL